MPLCIVLVRQMEKTIFAYDTESREVMTSIDLSKTLGQTMMSKHAKMVQYLDSLYYLDPAGEYIQVYKVD